jgi:hypothetical protein
MQKNTILDIPIRCYESKVLLIWTWCVCIVHLPWLWDFYPFIVLYYSTMIFPVDWDWLYSCVCEYSIMVDICTVVSNWQCPGHDSGDLKHFASKVFHERLESNFLLWIICINLVHLFQSFFTAATVKCPDLKAQVCSFSRPMDTWPDPFCF